MYAAAPDVHCTVSAFALPDDGYFGYPYGWTATCDTIADTLYVGAGASFSGGGLGADAGETVCRNTATCSGTGRFACLHEGSYNVIAGVCGLFPDTNGGGTVYDHCFQEPAGSLSSGGPATLSIEFEPSATNPNLVNGIVKYNLPQQYYIHTLDAIEYTVTGASYIFSPLLALSGKWVIPNLLPGAYLVVTPGGCTGDPALSGTGTSVIQVVVPSVTAKYQITAQNITAAGSAPAVKPITGALTASIPLGARFTLSLQKLSGGTAEPLSANFALGTVNLENAQIDPSLYPHDALLEFNKDASLTTQTFQAMHLGTQVVVITPDDGSNPPQLVTVQVIRPDHLGSANGTITYGGDSFDLDAKIVEWADKRGIPPQLIKGIMDRENGSRFNPMEWRYEPLVTDWDNFSPLGNNLRSSPLFAPYRMEYDAADPRGYLLVDSEDVHPRSRFYLVSTTGMAHVACNPPASCIDDGMQMVTAYTIVSQNEFWQHWLQNLQNRAKKALLTPQLIQQTLSWSAQTTLASSYGLMQVLFGETFETYGYPGINGQRRPYYLFDVPGNLRAGGGSIPTGSGLFVFKYRWENDFNETGEYSPQYNIPADLDDDYQNGLMGYNGSFCGASTCYGPDTTQRIQKYLPTSATPIFQ